MPSTKRVVAVRLSDEWYERLSACAAVQSRSLANMAVIAIQRAVEALEMQAPVSPVDRQFDRSMGKQSRNALCACGSGKKFKRCCEGRGMDAEAHGSGTSG
jgi:hypothetical protein